MLKLNRWLLFAILSCSAISCAPKPPDVFVFEYLQQHLATDPVTTHLVLTPSPTCMEKIKEPECGHGVSIVSGREIFVGEAEASYYKGKPWSALKAQSVYVPAVESYAPLATYMINACEKMHCSDQLNAFRVKLDALKGVSSAISRP